MTHGKNIRTSEQTSTNSPLSTGLLQRKCACGQYMVAGEECEECKNKRLQKKLSIGVSNDPLEQEADWVAEQVMRMPEPKLQRKGEATYRDKEEDEDKILQAKSVGSVGNSSAQVDHPLIQSVLSSPGQPLDAVTRSFMEPRFGQDFSGVRVHTGRQAAESARAVNALAYTVGRDLVFGEGQYAPGTDEGRRLVVHELAHVLQQTDAVGEQRSRTGQRAAAVVARSQGIIQRADGASLGSPAETPESGKMSPPADMKEQEEERFLVPIQAKLVVGGADDLLEREADEVADRVIRMPEPTVQTACAHQEQCSRYLEEPERKRIQRLDVRQSFAGDVGGQEAPSIVHEVLRSPGTPLEEGMRAYFEPRFGRDFGHVRVHTGKSAAAAASSVNALAFTVGRDVVFGVDRYAPNSQDGRKLLAHELTHVTQQCDLPARSTSSPTLSGDRRERKAEQATLQRGRAIIIGAAIGHANVYNCLKSLEKPMCDATWGPLENGGFRRWYFDFTGRKTPSNVEDAFGHCWVACAGTQRCGQTITFLTGRAREWYREYLDSDPHDSYSQDINNQALGREFGAAGANCDASCRTTAIVPPGRMDLSAPVMYLWSPRVGTELGPDNPRFRGSYTSPTSPPHAVEPVNQNEIDSTVNVFIQFLSSADREGYRRVMFTVSRTHTGRLITGIKKSNRQEKLLTNQSEHARTDMRALVQIAATNPVGTYIINALRENSGWSLSFDTV